MPTPNDLLKDLPSFYKHQTYHGVLFGFVRCYKLIYPSVTVKEVAGAFMKEFDIQEDQLDLMAAINTYNRMNKDFINGKRQEHKKESR